MDKGGWSSQTHRHDLAHPHTLTPSHRHRQVLRYAGCAFEAYADLDQEDVHLPRLTPNATSISYLDAEFLESAFEGVVKVEVLSAKLVGGSKTWWNPLSGIDAFKGDPFVKVTMDGTRVQTSTRSRAHSHSQSHSHSTHARGHSCFSRWDGPDRDHVGKPEPRIRRPDLPLRQGTVVESDGVLSHG